MLNWALTFFVLAIVAGLLGFFALAGLAAEIAKILLFAFLQFAATVRQPLDPANTNLTNWYDRMAARPSAAA